MPSNIVLINGSIKYLVGDSKMDGLMDYLNRHGYEQPGDRCCEEVKSDKIEEVKRDG